MSSPLLYRIDRFLKDSGLPPSQFGRMAVRDPRLVGDLRNGREPGPRLSERVERFIADWRCRHQSQEDGRC